MKQETIKKYAKVKHKYKKAKRKITDILHKTRNKMHFSIRSNSKQMPTTEIPLVKTQKDIFSKCENFTEAKKVMAAGVYPYFRVIESGQDIEVLINGKKMIMIGSNNYMGLTSDPRVKEAAIKAVEKYGTGCTGSRFLNGTLSLHVELEEKLAKFLNKESALLFSTGFQTNLGVISALVSKNEVIFADRSDHASIVDGCRLSFGKTVKFKHNDVEDLERLLVKYNNFGKLIVVDGVYSMEGDLAPLPEIVKLAKKYKARIMVDDAHSAGVFGEHGRGTAEHFNVEEDIDLIMFTFSKSFASIGGVIAGSEQVIHYLKHFSRELIFSASLPPASISTVIKALEIIEKEPERRENLWRITKKMKEGYESLGFRIGDTQSPIIPIYIGDDMLTFTMAKMLADEGVFVNPIVSPAVPPGSALIRTSYTATHTDEEMDFVLEKFKRAGKTLKII